MTDNLPDVNPASEPLQEAILAEATRWKERRAQLADEREVATQRLTCIDAEIGAIDARFRAAAILSPAVAAIIDEIDEAELDLALPDAIVKVFRTVPKGTVLNRETIKRKLPSVGYSQEKIKSNPNYVYIALRRLLTRELLEDAEGGFRLKPKAKSNEGSGG